MSDTYYIGDTLNHFQSGSKVVSQSDDHDARKRFFSFSSLSDRDSRWLERTCEREQYYLNYNVADINTHVVSFLSRYPERLRRWPPLVEYMLELLTSGTGLAVGLVVVVGIALAIIAVRIAIKLAIRAGIVAAVVLAGLYAVGVIG